MRHQPKLKKGRKMTKKKNLDELVQTAVEETLEQMGDEIAQRVARRLISDPDLSQYTRQLAVKEAAQTDPHKMFNPEAGP
jgi:hypothetical protein